MEHNGVHIEARNACTEAERVFAETVEIFSASDVSLDGVIKRGHCYCSGVYWSGYNHHQCCKCGDLQKAAPDEVEEPA